MCKEKQCTKCGTVRPVEEFAKQRSSKDGLRSQCKVCDYNYRLSKGTSAMPDKYEVNAFTMRNHMLLHFGFWEPRNHELKSESVERQSRKYYQPEHVPTPISRKEE